MGNVKEFGIVGNGIVLFSYNFEHNVRNSVKADLRGAYLNAILLYNDYANHHDIFFITMKKNTILLRRFKVKEEDLLFYLIVKSQRKHRDKSWKLYSEYLPWFSNFYNLYLQTIGEKLYYNLEKYDCLKPYIDNLMTQNKVLKI